MGAPNIIGDTTGAVSTNIGDIATGDLDDDGFLTSNADDQYSISSAASYGAASINPTTGEWTYVLDDSNPVVDDLDPGETLTDTFTVFMLDTGGAGAGQSDTQVVTITITGLPCFVRGTLIDTVDGPRPVEEIQPGDRVVTENGPMKVLWQGHRRVTRAELADNPKLLPVKILAGSLGNGLPKRDLRVSRQHRMLVSSSIVERMFGLSDVLIPAIKLAELPGIFVEDAGTDVAYHHLLFDGHQIVKAEGAPSESLFAGPEALASIGPEARAEILTLFPEIGTEAHKPMTARPVPSLKQQKQLVSRHAKNARPLLG